MDILMAGSLGLGVLNAIVNGVEAGCIAKVNKEVKSVKVTATDALTKAGAAHTNSVTFANSLTEVRNEVATNKTSIETSLEKLAQSVQTQAENSFKDRQQLINLSMMLGGQSAFYQAPYQQPQSSPQTNPQLDQIMAKLQQLELENATLKGQLQGQQQQGNK